MTQGWLDAARNAERLAARFQSWAVEAELAGNHAEYERCHGNAEWWLARVTMYRAMHEKWESEEMA